MTEFTFILSGFEITICVDESSAPAPPAAAPLALAPAPPAAAPLALAPAPPAIRCFWLRLSPKLYVCMTYLRLTISSWFFAILITELLNSSKLSTMVSKLAFTLTESK